MVDALTRANAVIVTLNFVALFLVGFVPLATSLVTQQTPFSLLPIAAASWLLGLGVVLALLVGALLGRVRGLSEELHDSTELLTSERGLIQQENASRDRARDTLRATESRLHATETRLAATEARLRTLAGNVPAAILTYDTSGRVVAAEGAGLGSLTNEPLVGRSVQELAAWYPTAAAHLSRALGGEEFTVVEQLADHAIETRYAPLREDAAVFGALAVSVDLRERDRAARALRESDERFPRMLESAPIAAALVGADGRIRLANRAFGEALGFAPRELSGLHFPEITHPEDRDLDATLHEQLLRGEIPSYVVEKRFLRKDGKAVWLEQTATVVRDAHGSPLYGVRMFQSMAGRERDQQVAEHYSRYDAITDLPNRVLLEERLEEWLAKMRREQQRLALVAFDVDNFSTVSDQPGRPAGDKVLGELARRLRAMLTDGDTLARVGVAEFALVLPRRGAAGAAEVVEKLVGAIEDGVSIDGQAVRVDLRLGFAMFPEDAADVGQLLRRADAALAGAKRAGHRLARYAEGAPV